MKGGDKRLYEKPKRNGNAKANIYLLCKNSNGNGFTSKGSRKANEQYFKPIKADKEKLL